jgi:hypothetical protein
MKTLDQNAIEEFAAIDPIYVDGRLEPLVNLGTNFAAYYFRWIPVHSSNGAIVYKKTPVLILVRPMSSLGACQDCKVSRMTGPPAEMSLIRGVN